MRRSFLFLLCFAVGSYAWGAEGSMTAGVELYQSGDYAGAAEVFSSVLDDPEQEASHADATFLLARSLLALDRIQEAAAAVDQFLLSYPDHPYYPEGVYLRGRVLYLQGEWESSIRAFRDFLQEYPESDLVPNAYYWAGECLFSLGKLDEALALFRAVVQDYPRSAKAEAARYRSDLISLHKRESELLKLLNVSHQETLKAIDEFEKRERTYEQAIAGYQRRLASQGTGDEQAVVERQLQEKDRRIADLESRVETLQRRLESAGASEGGARGSFESGVDPDLGERARLLRAKESALELKGRLLEALLQEAGQ